jgi:hypothetical protein
MQKGSENLKEYAVDDRECAVLPLELELEGSREDRGGRCWLVAGFAT